MLERDEHQYTRKESVNVSQLGQLVCVNTDEI
jgi:hypothetical protein